MDKKYLSIPDLAGLPAAVYFRHDEFGADTHAAPHRHAWGQLNYTSHGVMQLDIDGQRFLSPPHYAVWIPPNAEHSCYNRHAVVYRSVYLALEHCRDMPSAPSTLAISEILKAILNDFARRDVKAARSAADIRLAEVLVDQLKQAPAQACYLPYAHGPGLLAVLDALHANPGDNTPLSRWAERVHVSERTLARQFVRELGMGFGEWRQRLRFLASLEALERQQSVQEIAFDMGYSSASAFIAMFQRNACCTPEQYRRMARLG